MKVTINEASRELGISARTLDLWAKRGRIKYERSSCGWRLFNPAEVARVKGELTAKARKGAGGVC